MRVDRRLFSREEARGWAWGCAGGPASVWRLVERVDQGVCERTGVCLADPPLCPVALLDQEPPTERRRRSRGARQPKSARHECCEPVCKPDSVPAVSQVTVIHLGTPSPMCSSGLPGTFRRATGPCLALLRVGFAEPPPLPATLVSSYLTVSPLPDRSETDRHRRCAFCCTFRRVSPPGSYPAPCPVESGLSSTRGRLAPRGDRPTSSLGLILPPEPRPATREPPAQPGGEGRQDC